MIVLRRDDKAWRRPVDQLVGDVRAHEADRLAAVRAAIQVSSRSIAQG